MLVLCYPKCTTCQKTVKWLEEKGVSYTYRDIKEQNPTYEELKAWYERSGLPLKRFFNTSGLQYERGGTAASPGHRRDAGEASPAGGRPGRLPRLQGAGVAGDFRLTADKVLFSA